MGIDKLISISVTLAVLTVSTGQLPRVLKAIRIAQLQLIKESQTSKWGTPMLPLLLNQDLIAQIDIM